MSLEMITRSRYMRVQSYGDTLAVVITKPFAKELGIEKQSTVKTYISNGILHVEPTRD